MDEIEHTQDWTWQLAHRITTIDALRKVVELDEDELAGATGSGALSFAITPYYATRLKSAALRRTVVPSMQELYSGEDEFEDPLGEEAHRVTPHLIHTYPDKVLFLVSRFCPVYCRYCTRSRLVGEPNPAQSASFESSFQYIAAHPEIRDVLISGGDPLSLTDSVLDDLLTRIRAIPHVRMVRVGSKVPAVLPMRITDALCDMLRKDRVWLSLHFTHPDELSEETRTACRKLADHGVGMVSQTVLLKGVNDDADTLTELFYGLLEMNVKPYYLLQCDPVRGSAHFRTPVEQGIRLIQSLHGRISGLAIPQYVIDAPGGGGKVPLLSMEQLTREGSDVTFLNYAGERYRYPDSEAGKD